MSRLVVLRRHPKRTLAGLTVALAAIGVAIGSGASFTSSSTNNPATSFTAGTLKQDLGTPAGTLSATAQIANIKPGWGTTGGNSGTPFEDPTSPGYGQVTVTNTGSLDNLFTVAGSVSDHHPGTDTTACGGGSATAACADLEDALKVKIVAEEGTPASPVSGVAYNGLVSGLSGSTTLGSGSGDTFTLSPSATRTYKAYFYLPAATDDTFQGGDATVNLTFTGAQTAANESTTTP
jgi:spore coat-associated protein N